MKLTDWFPPEMKPIYKGWYESYKNSPEMSRKRFWDGENWMFSDTPERHWQQYWSWRGLAEKPE